MKTINSVNYFKYLAETTKCKLRNGITYFNIGLIAICALIFIFSSGWNNLLTATLLFSTALSFVFMVVELIFVVIRTRVFNQNLWITYTIAAIVLILLNYLIFDERQRYWSFVSGILFLIPIFVTIVVTRIASWFR